MGHGIRYAAGHYAGIYLAEYGRKSWLAEVIRFLTTFCSPRRRLWLVCLFTPSGGADGALLWLGGCNCAGAVEVPIVIRTTENMLKLVPDSLVKRLMRWVHRSGK